MNEVLTFLAEIHKDVKQLKQELDNISLMLPKVDMPVAMVAKQCKITRTAMWNYLNRNYSTDDYYTQNGTTYVRNAAALKIIQHYNQKNAAKKV